MLSRKPGRRAKKAAHPFAFSGDRLNEWATHLAPSIRAEAQNLLLWLPGSERQPQASPELQATGVFASDESASLQLRAWQVEGLALTLSDAIDLLVALPHRSDLGRDLRFWRAAALEALALVAKPAGTAHAGTRRFPPARGLADHAGRPERLSALAAQMPPVCRALTETPERTVSATQLLDAFITPSGRFDRPRSSHESQSATRTHAGRSLVEGAHRGRHPGEAPGCRR